MANLDIGTIAAVPISEPRPILEVMILNGCWDLPASFLMTLAEHVCTFELGNLSLMNLLKLLAEHILKPPELCDDLLVHIFSLRKLEMEPDHDAEDVAKLEYVLDAFDKQERVALEKKIVDVKCTRVAAHEFADDYMTSRLLRDI